MKSKITSKVVFCTLLIMTILSFPLTGYASQDGNTMASARVIQFGQSYYKSWGRNTDHLNHYVKFTVPKRGIISIMAQKPYDDEGEYGKLLFSLYDENGEIIWNYGSYKSQKDARDFYLMKVGLKKGVYYLTILPKFRVVYGIVDTTYNISFTADSFAEVEPNNSLAEATAIKLGEVYSGHYGYDGGNTGRDDYYRFNLAKGKTYKIAMGNFAKIEGTTTILKLIDPNGNSKSIAYEMENRVDGRGMNYILYTPSLSGYHYISLSNYGGIQYNYTIGVSLFQKLTQKITGLSKNYKLTVDTSELTVSPKAIGDIKVSSSNTNVVRVYYYSSSKEMCIYPRGVGSATITITAAETGQYAKAVRKIPVTVIPKRAKLISVKNLSGMIMEIDWDWSDHNNILGYEFQVSLSQDFKTNVKTYRSAKKYSGYYLYESSGLRKNRVYYVRVRTYKVVGGTKYCSTWSYVKKVYMKK